MHWKIGVMSPENQIDLIDGAELAEMLKELGLGLRKEVVEVFDVDQQWFEEF